MKKFIHVDLLTQFPPWQGANLDALLNAIRRRTSAYAGSDLRELARGNLYEVIAGQNLWVKRWPPGTMSITLCWSFQITEEQDQAETVAEYEYLGQNQAARSLFITIFAIEMVLQIFHAVFLSKTCTPVPLHVPSKTISCDAKPMVDGTGRNPAGSLLCAKCQFAPSR